MDTDKDTDTDMDTDMDTDTDTGMDIQETIILNQKNMVQLGIQ